MSKVTSQSLSGSSSNSGFEMNPDREAFLRNLGAALNWVDRKSIDIDPYTAAYCAKAGWVSRRVTESGRQYRITDAGLEAMMPGFWR